MSDDRISLDFLGEQMLRMQADLRGVRSDQLRIESEQTTTRADLRRLEGKIESVDDKLDRFMGSVNARFASVDAQFEQAARTATVNLEIILTELTALKNKL